MISKDLEGNCSGIMDVRCQHLTERDEEENRENECNVRWRPRQDSNVTLPDYSSAILL